MHWVKAFNVKGNIVGKRLCVLGAFNVKGNIVGKRLCVLGAFKG